MSDRYFKYGLHHELNKSNKLSPATNKCYCTTCFEPAPAKPSSTQEPLQQIALYAHALMDIWQVINWNCEITLRHRDIQAILEKVAVILGQTLGIDCMVVYEIGDKKQLIKEYYCWHNIMNNFAKVTLAGNIDPVNFKSSKFRTLKEGQWQQSHYDQVNPQLLADGLSEFVHQKMGIKSAFWYPVMWGQNCFCVSVYQISHRRYWCRNEIKFIATVASQVKRILQTAYYQSQYRQMEKMLQTTEKLAVIGQMAAGMAHEIKNPLTSVRGFAQLLKQRTAGDPVLASYASIILDEVDQANKVIMDFLQLARPREPVLKKQPLNMAVQEILNLVEPQAFMRNINVDCQDNSANALVFYDKDQIKQVLLNICQNAMDAMPSGGLITISLGGLPQNEQVYIDIQDTGVGITQERLAQLGLPFYTTKEQGTGLGLSVSFSIIDLHQGRIDVTSEEGKGTKFRIILPIAD